MFTNNRKAHSFVGVSIMMVLMLEMQACSSMGSLVGENPEGAVRATWTPVVHPTDESYAVEVETFSGLAESPLVVIFGGDDPEDDSPLQATNLSTEDIYDVSTLDRSAPGPGRFWQRIRRSISRWVPSSIS
jgi:hypothetical protein